MRAREERRKKTKENKRPEEGKKTKMRKYLQDISHHDLLHTIGNENATKDADKRVVHKKTTSALLPVSQRQKSRLWNTRRLRDLLVTRIPDIKYLASWMTPGKRAKKYLYERSSLPFPTSLFIRGRSEGVEENEGVHE